MAVCVELSKSEGEGLLPLAPDTPSTTPPPQLTATSTYTNRVLPKFHEPRAQFVSSFPELGFDDAADDVCTKVLVDEHFARIAAAWASTSNKTTS